MLGLGQALTMTGDAVSEVQGHLRAIAAGYGYARANVSVLPTFLMVSVREGEVALVRNIDGSRQLRLDQASAVIRVARWAEEGRISPAQGLVKLERALTMSSRFGTAWYVISHALLTVGSGSSSAQSHHNSGCICCSARSSAP